MAAKTLINKHPLNETLKDLRKLETKVSKELFDGSLEPDIESGLQRAFLFAKHLQSDLSNSSDIDVSPAGLDTINRNLRGVIGEITNYLSNKNNAHLDVAITNLDGAVTASSGAFIRSQTGKSNAYGESIEAVKSAATTAIKSIKGQQVSLAKRIEEEDQKLESQSTRVDEIKGIVESASSNANAAIGEINKKFAELETQYNSRIADNLDAANSRVREFLDSKETIAKAALDSLEEHQKKAARIVQIVGNIGTTGGYSNTYSDESKKADQWRLVTVGFFAVGILLAIATLVTHLVQEWITQNYEADPFGLALRLLVAFVITVPAFYTARESARHRSNADQAKRTELELATLEPFMEFLPEDSKNQLKIKLSERYFGNSSSPHEIAAPVNTKDISKVLQELAALVDKVRR